MKSITTTGALSLVAASLFQPSTADAHAYLQIQTASAGYRQDIEVRVPHGCSGQPTNEVRIQIPDGVTRVVPEIKPGWNVEMVMRTLDEPFKGEGGVMVTETVDQLVYTGGNLPDLFFEKFTFRVALPNTPNETLYFKTVQKCSNGEELRWIEVPEGGKKWFEYEYPAPPLLLTTPEGPQYPF